MTTLNSARSCAHHARLTTVDQVAFLVNSGSEANDLALRVSRAAAAAAGRPGATHVAVMGGAYHGHLTTTMAIRWVGLLVRAGRRARAQGGGEAQGRAGHKAVPRVLISRLSRGLCLRLGMRAATVGEDWRQRAP
jgi:glutamate-1-semialdehyde aminotransferase